MLFGFIHGVTIMVIDLKETNKLDLCFTSFVKIVRQMLPQ